MNKAIIIGSGISGLAMAIRLRIKGYQVIILEKNDTPGGKINQFTWENFRWDTGASLFTMPHLVSELFTLAGKNPDNYLKYSKLENVCRYFFTDGTVVNTYAERLKLIEEFHTKTRTPKKTIIKYLNRYSRLYKITAPLFLFRQFIHYSTLYSKYFFLAAINFYRIGMFRNMNKANSLFIKNRYLVQLFNRFATYNGSSPYKTPSTLNVISHLELTQGAYFPINGMYSIVEALVKLANDIGVDIHKNEEVLQIEWSKNKISTVISDKQKYEVDYLISGIDVIQFYKKLTAKKILKRFEKQPRSTSAITFYWAVNKEFPQLELHNILFSENYREEFKHLFTKKELYHDPTLYVFISKKLVKNDAPDGNENWYVMMNVPENINQNWNEWVDKARDWAIHKIEQQLNIEIRSHILHEEVMDPVTIEEKTASYRGSLYGSSSNNLFSAFYRHPNYSGKFKNLFFTGGSVHPGGGIPLCISSAKLVDEMIPTIN